MIAVDTNVLLSYVLQDHEDQSRRANILFAGDDPVLICDIVLAKAVWVLTGVKYRVGRADVVSLIQSLIQEPNIRFEDSQRIWQALSLFKGARRRQGNQAGFADVLILLSCRSFIEDRGDSFGGWYTFDQGVRLLEGARSP